MECIRQVFCCAKGKHRRNAVVDIKVPTQQLQLSPPQVSQYAILEDHLHLVDTPSLLSEDGTTIRPLSATNLFKSHRPPSPESLGMTMEFLPEDNTVLLIEARGHKVSKITKTKIILDETIYQTPIYSTHKGLLGEVEVTVHKFKIKDEETFDSIKQEFIALDGDLEKLTPYPRYIRYLGTCFNQSDLEAFVITDFVAGASFRDIRDSEDIKEAMNMTEPEIVQAAADVSDAIYFLHSHSKPVIHGSIGLASVMIDGETHRAKLMSRHAMTRLQRLRETPKDSWRTMVEKAPEIIKAAEPESLKSDVWSSGSAILEILLSSPTWDMNTLGEQFATDDYDEVLKVAMELEMEPTILSVLQKANVKLSFLANCLNYNSDERPTAALLRRGLEQCTLEIRKDAKTPQAQVSSYIWPSKRILNSARTRIFDPLKRQQIEWNVKDESGCKRRAILFGNRTYAGDTFRSLSVTPVNDVKDMSTLLRSHGFALGNVYESVKSRQDFEDTLKAYVETVNKDPEDIDLMVFYYSGRGMQGLPSKLARKRRLGIFLDRVGICHDLALVTANETLFPVAKLQTIVAKLNPRVKRKVIILDCRLASDRKKKSSSKLLDPFTQQQSSFSTSESQVDWEVPVIAEESLDRLTTMFTIYPKVEEHVSLVAADSHPKKTNGFLTGCLIHLMQDRPNTRIEDLPRRLNMEMEVEASKAKAFQGISCHGDFIPIENDIWMTPLLEPS